MYLSQLFLNPTNRSVQQDLADRYGLHRTILSAFDYSDHAPQRVLFRLDTVERIPVLLIQSQDEPNWQQSDRINRDPYLRFAPAVKTWQPSFRVGQTLRFRVMANPTIKRQGKRHALLKDEQQHDWITRKALEHGFRVDAVQTGDVKRISGRNAGQHMIWHQVAYEGVLSVTDASLFDHAVRTGIGSAKAFGFGMISAAPLTLEMRR